MNTEDFKNRLQPLIDSSDPRVALIAELLKELHDELKHPSYIPSLKQQIIKRLYSED